MPQAGLSESQLDEVWQETRYSRPRISGRAAASGRAATDTPRPRRREAASWWDGEVPVPVPVRAPQGSARAAVAAEDPVAAPEPLAPAPERRTVTITGRGADPYRSSARRRPPRSAHERVGIRPDRTAMWAVLLGVLLILVAATSSHAAIRVAAPRPALHAPGALHAAAAPHPRSAR